MNCYILAKSMLGLPSQTFIHALGHVQVSRLFQERVLARSTLSPPTYGAVMIKENCLSFIQRGIVLLVNKLLVESISPFFVSVFTHFVVNTIFALDYWDIVRDVLLL